MSKGRTIRTVRLGKDLDEAVREEAARQDRSVSSLLRQALRESIGDERYGGRRRQDDDDDDDE